MREYISQNSSSSIAVGCSACETQPERAWVTKPYRIGGNNLAPDLSVLVSTNWPGLLNFGYVGEGRTMSMCVLKYIKAVRVKQGLRTAKCRSRTAIGSKMRIECKMLTADQG